MLSDERSSMGNTFASVSAALPDGGRSCRALTRDRRRALGTSVFLFLVALGGAGLGALGARLIAGRMLSRSEASPMPPSMSRRPRT